MCGAYGGFRLHLPSRARHSLMSVRGIKKKKNKRLTGKEICKVLAAQEIRANLVVLAIDVVLAIVGSSTRLPKMKMTLATRESLDNCDFAIPGLIAVVRRMVAVVLAHFAGCRNASSLLGVWPQQVIGLQVSNHLVLTSFLDSFRLCTSISLSCQIAPQSTLTVWR